jgi:hypothetical protein
VKQRKLESGIVKRIRHRTGEGMMLRLTFQGLNGTFPSCTFVDEEGGDAEEKQWGAYDAGR